jgi:hypothetical protein
MSLTSNVVGQMYALTVLTPISPGYERGLRDFLDGLQQGPSPLSRLPATHFARFVIVPDFVPDPSERHPDVLPCPYLLFSATFDGSLDDYLENLCGPLVPETEEIWGRCVGAPIPASGSALAGYLRHNQIQTGLFFAAYPNADAQTVKDALETREKAIAFARAGQGMDAKALREAFIEEFGA